MLKGLSNETMIEMLDARINILCTRGETMNQGIINKLERQKRKLKAASN